MRYFKRTLFILVLFITTHLSGQELLVEAPRIVSLDEAFKVVFSASGEITDFKDPVFTGLEVMVGPNPYSNRQISFVNGKQSSSTEMGYTYIVRPLDAGIAKISSTTAKVNGKSVTTQEISIEILNSNEESSSNSGTNANDANTTTKSTAKSATSRNDIVLKLFLSKSNVVRGETIVATLKLYSRVPILGFSDFKFPVFDGFWSQEIETSRNVNFSREKLGNEIYDAAVIKRYLLIPQQNGELVINPAEMVCDVQVQMRNSGARSFFDDFFDSGYQVVKKRVATDLLKVNVKPLPSNAPLSFGGGVGKFSMNVKLSRDGLKAHEAASLLVEISGSGNLNLIENPNVELPADFEKYDVKTNNSFTNGVNGISGKKSFEYPFIPRSEGRFVMAPLEYSYYDISAQKYVTLRSDSLVVNVERGEAYTSAPTVAGIAKQGVANLSEDIRYILVSNHNVFKKGRLFVLTWPFIFVVLFIVLLFIISSLLFGRVLRLRQDVKRSRNKRANKVAVKRLKLAQGFMRGGNSAEFYEEVHKALLGYISDKLAIPFAQMQRETIADVLASRDVQEDNLNELLQLLEDCELARYSMESKEGGMESLYERAITVISNLEDRL